MKNLNFKKLIRIMFCLVIIAIIGYLRLFFSGNVLCENDAVLYTEAVKIVYNVTPFPYFTFKWTPIFLTGYYGWILPDFRALVYFFLPFLKVQFYITAMFGIAVIFSTYRLALRLYDKKNIALAASLLISIVPIHVSMSYGLSSEIPQTFFLLEAFNFLIDFIKKNRRRDFLISGVFLAFSVLSKPISALTVPAFCFLFIINKEKLTGNIFKTMVSYAVLPSIIWLSWGVPNFYRIFGDVAHSFSMFGFNVGSETMKIGFIESHLQILSTGGLVLLVSSLLYLARSRSKEDIFLLFLIASSFILLYSLKDVMAYWYPFIIPFYCIAISKTFFSLASKAIKIVFLTLMIYFIGICVRTDIINLCFDFNSQSGFYMRPDSKVMHFPLAQCQKNLDTIEALKGIFKKDDLVFLTGTFNSYKGFLMDMNTHVLPGCNSIKNGRIEYDDNWPDQVNLMINEALQNKKGRVVLVIQDGGYYYRVYDKGVWLETHQADMLEAAGFSKIYEERYPDAKALNKAKLFYIHAMNNQWAKNYIFIKEYY
jgi:hypothetical protein